MLYEGKPLSPYWESPGSILPPAGLDEEFLVVCGGCKLIWTFGMVPPPPKIRAGEMDPPKAKEGSSLAREEGIRKGKVWKNNEHQQKKMMEVTLEHCSFPPGLAPYPRGATVLFCGPSLSMCPGTTSPSYSRLLWPHLPVKP